MTVDSESYNETPASRFGVTHKSRSVNTPMPGGSTEKTENVLYESGEYVLKVFKVSDLGWTWTLYGEGGDSIRSMQSGQVDERQTAEQAGRAKLSEVLRQ